jgi:hypothetical protein
VGTWRTECTANTGGTNLTSEIIKWKNHTEEEQPPQTQRTSTPVTRMTMTTGHRHNAEKESRQHRHEDANTEQRSIASSQIQAGESIRQRTVAEANPVEVGESCRGRRSPGQSRKASPVEEGKSSRIRRVQSKKASSVEQGESSRCRRGQLKQASPVEGGDTSRRKPVQ